MTPKKIYGWEGFELTSGDLVVGLTPIIGGRIMSVSFQGHELLFIDPKHTAETFDPKAWTNLPQAKSALGFRLWGGDKTWIAPQKDWLEGTPPLDLDAAPYTFIWEKDEAVMTSPICRETGLQIIRRVALKEGRLHLVEELINCSSKPLQKGVWNVTQVKRPCSFEIPAIDGAFISYHHEDKTLPAYKGDLSVKKGVLMIDCVQPDLFKVGGIPSKGEVVIHCEREGQRIRWQKNFTLDPQANYAHGSAVEVFNASGYPYAEIELHSSFKILNPGASVKLEQSWEISACSSNIQALQ